MYSQYFHFSELPFSIATDPHFIYMSPRHQEALAHLLYGINFGGGFVALTGEVGTGKTTLCHCLLQQIPNNIDIALILNPKLNAIELLATLCDELGIGYDKNQQALKNLIDRLNQHLLTTHANGRRTVLLIDEAQNLSFEVLEQIRLLTNLETHKTKLLQIILVGQPELQDLLKRQDLRQLNQRITARYHLLPLSLAETREYIHHRLTVANGQPGIFKPSAISKIYKLSSGIPRVINILCDRALLGAYSSNTRVITSAIISRAAAETLGIKNKKSPQLTVIVSLLLLASIAWVAYFQSHDHDADQPVPIKRVMPVVIPALPELSRSPDQQVSLPGEKITPVPVAKPKTFQTWVNTHEHSLDTELTNALKLWGKPIPKNKKVDCHYAETTGLHCVFGKVSWKDLLARNHPVILEFSLAGKDKRHALLTGLGKNQAMLHFNKESFTIAEVLKYWNGYYLILEAQPIPAVNLIYPRETSDAVLWLRHLLSVDGKNDEVVQPRFFDDKLSARVIAFQHQQHLVEDGIVGGKTMYHLKNRARNVDVPHLKVSD